MADKRFDQAERAFAALIDQHPDHTRVSEARAQSAIALARQDRHAEALEAIQGAEAPAPYIQRLADAAKEDRQKVAVEIAAEIVREAKHCCQGAHLMTLGWDHCVPDIVQQAELN